MEPSKEQDIQLEIFSIHVEATSTEKACALGPFLVSVQLVAWWSPQAWPVQLFVAVDQLVAHYHTTLWLSHEGPRSQASGTEENVNRKKILPPHTQHS